MLEVGKSILFAGVACPTGMADIVFILDESTSIVYNQGGYSNWYDDILAFAQNVSAAFSISPTQTQIGLIKFSDNTTIGFYLNQYTSEASVINAIGQEDITGGETNIAAALQQTRF